MDRSAVLTFCEQLRQARDNAFRDAEAFDEIIHVVERLGSFLDKKLGDLGKYKKNIEERARQSALAEDVPVLWRGLHIPFSLLYDLVKDARNDALHQGACARYLTGHAIELALVLEDALRRSLDFPVVGDYMVRHPVCAELWQPLSFIRQQMLANSFSYLPVKSDTGDWCFVSDLDIATYLGTDASKRKPKLAQNLRAAQIPLQPTTPCTIDTPLEEALSRLGKDKRPLLVCRQEQGEQVLIGILTAFDLL
jgi:CBS domain-containing protein